jgi:probable rRNA maturation factor
MIKFEINKLTPKKEVDEKFLIGVAKKTAKELKFKKPQDAFGENQISIVLTRDARMKNLNKIYRGKKGITDVLAFDYGEIFICVPQAKRQAKELGHSLKQELGILLIHGLLHLAGYDDQTKKEYNKMKKKQEDIWQKIM